MLSAFSLAVTAHNEKATGDKFSAAFNTVFAEEFSQWEERGALAECFTDLYSASSSYLLVVLYFPKHP